MRSRRSHRFGSRRRTANGESAAVEVIGSAVVVVRRMANGTANELMSCFPVSFLTRCATIPGRFAPGANLERWVRTICACMKGRHARMMKNPRTNYVFLVRVSICICSARTQQFMTNQRPKPGQKESRAPINRE